MSDYIIRQPVEKLKPHPINETIYDFDEKQHLELLESIDKNGLLEPITIDNQNYVYSGHRRLQAVKELGWIDIDCRLTTITNPIIQIIESNHQRKKTTTEILRESELLKQEYSKLNGGRGRRNDLNGRGKTWTAIQVSQKLDVSLTKLKKLKSIQHYQPELLQQIDLGIVSVGKAYEIVRKNHILQGKGGRPLKGFEIEFRELLKKYSPTIEDVILVLDSSTISPNKTNV